MKFYTIAVQRWPLPIMRKIRAVSHFWNPDETRLTVVNLLGNAISFPRMDRRRMTLYADYRTFKQALEPIKAEEVFHEEADTGPKSPHAIYAEMTEVPIPFRNGLDHTEVAQADGG